MKRLVASLLLSITISSHAAEVIPVKPMEDCFLCSSAPSMTMYWQGRNSKALMIMLPGGDGYLGVKPEMTDINRPFIENLKRLTNPDMTKGQVDLVFLDNPRVITPFERDLSGRGTKEHMIRIESALKFYKEKTRLPVWILGQSNGGVSLANFLHYMQEKNESHLIAGVIASTTRPESNFPSTLSVPFMFITHKLDGCRNLDQIHGIYEKVKAANTATTKWVVTETGEAEAGRDACYSGYHMFYKAGEEYSKAIDDFIAQH